MSLASIEGVGTLATLMVMAVIVTLLYNMRHAILSSKVSIPLPPGPPARWFWEDAMPSVNTSYTLAGLVAEYGPVVALRAGSHVTIVIGSVDAAAWIMEKEGSVLADRPRSIAGGELLSKGLRLLLVHSGERLRRLRRAIHTHLQPKAVRAYRDMQLEHAKNLIMDILNDPKNHKAHALRFSASVILRLTYGMSTPTSSSDPEVVRILQAMKNLQRALRPGAYLVDSIPLLKYMPGYGRDLAEYHKFEIQLFREQMDRVRSDMEKNDASGSFARTLLECQNKHRLSMDEMAYLAGSLYGAGSETSAIAITNMILAAACFPDAQRRVQEELDMVVGRGSLPTWDDTEVLLQLQAFVLEVLRWRPVSRTGVAHRATHDIIWKGYCIPAGATVFGCHWAISRDSVAFPEPEKFDPQRWIDAKGRLRKGISSYPYGFGRRVCPGQHLTNGSLYITLAVLLWSFRIVERPDAPIDPNDYTDNFVSCAAPFEVEFIPRIEESRLKEMMSKLEM